MLDKATIIVIGNKDDYNMIKDNSVVAMSNNEYVFADEFFSFDECIFYDNDFAVPEYSEEAGVNVIVPHFGVSAPVEITYRSKPVVSPVVFFCPVLSHMN